MAGLYRNVLSICLMSQRNDEPAIRDANPSNNIAMTQTLAWSTLPIGLLAFGVADRRHALKRARQ